MSKEEHKTVKCIHNRPLHPYLPIEVKCINKMTVKSSIH